MSTLFRATIGLGIAFYLWSPGQAAAVFHTQTVANLRAQIEAAHPQVRLHSELMALNASAGHSTAARRISLWR